jgi:phosphoribosylformylglycinamidine synthase
MKDVVRFANNGGTVIGICNGFQVLTEAGLLPGVLLRNRSLRFICKYIRVRVESDATRFTNASVRGATLEMPIAHGEGDFFAEPDTIKKIEENGQVLFRYCDGDGNLTDEANPNGSLNSIAGIVNEAGNVLGFMPHPERASESILGHEDGRKVFESLINHHLQSDTRLAGLITAERS